MQMSPSEVVAARAAVVSALAEDLGPALVDLTEPAVLGHRVTANLVARQPGVVCGLAVAELVLRERGVADVRLRAHDGDAVEAGDVVLVATGDAAQLLSAERTALNFVQRLSGTATLTRAFVDAVAGTAAMIVDTRKTTPGMRALQRHAVRCGGGGNHRFGLFDEAMVKDNHADAAGIEAAVDAIRTLHPGVRVHVEARDLDEVRQALAARADVVLLDNMSLPELREAVALVGDRALTEASGGVTLATVRAIAETGVARISVGALTHSAPAWDCALDLAQVPPDLAPAPTP